MAPPALKKFDAAAEAQHYHLAPDKLVAGNPQQTVWMDYTDPSGRFLVGTWRSEPGTWRIAYTEEEYCHMLEGRSIVTDEAGHAVTVCAGESFVVPRGFVGTWEVVQTTTKRFVIYEPGAAPAPGGAPSP